MIQFDTDLEFAIFSKVYDETLEKLKLDLSERKQKLKWVYERENLTAEQLKKANAEETHILLIVEYIMVTEELFKKTRDVMFDRKQVQIDWHHEYIKEAEKGVQFTQMMIEKYSKLRANESK